MGRWLYRICCSAIYWIRWDSWIWQYFSKVGLIRTTMETILQDESWRTGRWREVCIISTRIQMKRNPREMNIGDWLETELRPNVIWGMIDEEGKSDPIPRKKKKKTRGMQNTYEEQDQKRDYGVQRVFISEGTGRLTKVSLMRLDFHIWHFIFAMRWCLDAENEWWMMDDWPRWCAGESAFDLEIGNSKRTFGRGTVC